MVQEEEEDDEETKDGLVTKRTRAAPSSPPALQTPTPPSPPAPLQPVQATPLAAAPPVVESSDPNFIENPPSASTPFVSVGEGPPSTTSIAGAALGGDEGAQISPILITESPTSPPRQEAPLALQTEEGGGESLHQTPPSTSNDNLKPPNLLRRDLGTLHSPTEDDGGGSSLDCIESCEGLTEEAPR